MPAEIADRQALADSVSAGVERSRDTAMSAIDSAVQSYPDLRDNVMSMIRRLSDTAKPTADRAASSLPSSDELRAAGTTVIEKFQETVVPAAADAIHQIRDRVEENRDRSPQAPALLAATGATAQRAVDRSSQTMHRAVESSRNAAQETLAAAAWMTIAGTLLYFVLLSDEQREKVKSFVVGAFEQVQLLIQDFRGYEDEF
ncbi:MAG: hypothetical protein M9890_00830 [Thermomicrobiales bacterium]|nr:hypothetical protein [Thermomicrobiales bacterium]